MLRRSRAAANHLLAADGNEATLSGKHDRADAQDAAKLLQTGPILIRGLGKGVKDTFVPGRPSRHRAFLDGADEGADESAALAGLEDAEPAATALVPPDRISECDPSEPQPVAAPRSSGGSETVLGSSMRKPTTHSATSRLKMSVKRAEEASASNSLSPSNMLTKRPRPDSKVETAMPGSPHDSELSDRANQAGNASDVDREEERESLRAPDLPDAGATSDINPVAPVKPVHTPQAQKAASTKRGTASSAKPTVRKSRSAIVREPEADASSERKSEAASARRAVPLAERIAALPFALEHPAADDSALDTSVAHTQVVADSLVATDATAESPADIRSGAGHPDADQPGEADSGQASPAEASAVGAAPIDDRGAPTPVEVDPAALVATSASPLRPGGVPSRPPRVPLLRRFGRETTGFAVLAVLVLVCAVLIAAVIHKTNSDAATAAQEAASYTPPPLAAPSTASSSSAGVVVIGDETVTKAASGVSSSRRWPALLDAGAQGSVQTLASPGAGYTTAGSDGETFVQQAADIPSNAKVVVFFGGLNDSNALALDVSKAATSAFSAAKKQAPKAKFLVVGPVVEGALSTADVKILRNVLKVSAEIANFTWIDPINGSWVDSAATKQATSLSGSDETAISKKLKSAIQAALG